MRADSVRVRLTKIQVAAEFVIDPEGDGELEPGSYGPVALTAAEWAGFDLQAAVEGAVDIELDKLSQPATLPDSS